MAKWQTGPSFRQRWFSPLQIIAILVILASIVISVVFREYQLADRGSYQFTGPEHSMYLPFILKAVSILFMLLMAAAHWGLLREQWRRLSKKKRVLSDSSHRYIF